jgi:hypothetical protein
MSAKIVAAILSLALGQVPTPGGPIAPPESRLSDTAWDAMINKRVRVETVDGSHAGTLSAHSSSTVVLISDDGIVIELEKSRVSLVKIEALPPPSLPQPAQPQPAQPTVVVGPTMPSCFGDNQCEHPRQCIAGQCAVPLNYVDALEREGNARVKAGKWTMVTGSGLAGIGLLLVAVGIPVANATDRRFYQGGCGYDGFGELNGPAGCEPLEKRRYTAYDLYSWAGPIVGSLGALTLLAGAITYGVGKQKLKRVGRYRPTAVAGRGVFSIGLRGEF